MAHRQVFITGGTGYLGRNLIPLLLKRGHSVRALVRPGSESKLPGGSQAIIGNALAAESFAGQIRPADTFVHLVGVPRPSPAKAKQFRAVDLPSIRASVSAASEAGIGHFIYVSVAHPAPIMKAYIEVRTEGEKMVRESGLNATILRPWYVLGPGHRWPYLLLPAYWLMERFPSTKESAVRLGLLTLEEMLKALLGSVENVCDGICVYTVPQIRQLARAGR